MRRKCKSVTVRTKYRESILSVQAALRWNQYKLITGSPGRHTGWDVPPTKMHGNASSIFDKVELPQVAYIDDIKATVRNSFKFNPFHAVLQISSFIVNIV